MIKRVSKISISKYKYIINQNKFWNIKKKHITKKSRNTKLKEKYYINEKLIQLQKKNFIFHHSLKFNKQGGPNKLQGGGVWSEKN